MNEDALNKLPTDVLLDTLMQRTKELIDLVHSENKIEYEAKKHEVQLIQRVVVARRAEFRPGPSLL
jgi:hypothetical protein